MEEQAFKVCVIGDGAVGKTSIVRRLIQGQFNPAEMTVGLGHEIYSAPWQKEGVNAMVRLVFWDLGGQWQFRLLHTRYMHGVSGLVCVYDASRPQSFYNLDRWFDLLFPSGDHDIPAILLGNKADLLNVNVISDDELFTMMDVHRINKHFLISAKSGKNVKESFMYLIDLLMTNTLNAGPNLE
jgi:small GTP-binding protein